MRNLTTRAAHTPQCRARFPELITQTEKGRSRIDRATERATREDAAAAQGDAQQGGEKKPPVLRKTVSSDGRFDTHTDEHGNVVKMSYVGRPPMTAEGQEADDEPPPPPPPVSPTPPGAAQNRRRIFHEYRDKKAQKRPAEDPPDDPRAA